jgi:hypothetical protein
LITNKYFLLVFCTGTRLGTHKLNAYMIQDETA